MAASSPWQQLSKLFQRGATAIGVTAGLAVVAELVVASLSLPIWPIPDYVSRLVDVRALETWSIDYLQRTRAAVRKTDLKGIPTVLVDIDDITYQQWNKPERTPRDRLGALIRRVADEGARVIIVDIDLRSPSSNDDSLRQALESIEKADILIPRILAPSRTRQDVLIYDTTPFDDLEKKENIWFADAGFDTDFDRVTRKHSAWRDKAGPDRPTPVERIVPIPTIGFLASRLADPRKADDRLRLVCAFKSTVPDSCRDNPTPSFSLASARLHSTTEPSPDFAIVFDVTNSDLLGGVSHAVNYEAEGRHVQLPQVTRLSAFALMAHPLIERDKSRIPTVLNDSVVVIGNTHVNIRDHWFTPVGNMPGAVLLINSINSFMHYDAAHEPAWNRFAIFMISVILTVVIVFALVFWTPLILLDTAVRFLARLTKSETILRLAYVLPTDDHEETDKKSARGSLELGVSVLALGARTYLILALLLTTLSYAVWFIGEVLVENIIGTLREGIALDIAVVLCVVVVEGLFEAGKLIVHDVEKLLPKSKGVN